jgi:hypothetical protein
MWGLAFYKGEVSEFSDASGVQVSDCGNGPKVSHANLCTYHLPVKELQIYCLNVRLTFGFFLFSFRFWTMMAHIRYVKQKTYACMNQSEVLSDRTQSFIVQLLTPVPISLSGILLQHHNTTFIILYLQAKRTSSFRECASVRPRTLEFNDCFAHNGDCPSFSNDVTAQDIPLLSKTLRSRVPVRGRHGFRSGVLCHS